VYSQEIVSSSVRHDGENYIECSTRDWGNLDLEHTRL